MEQKMLITHDEKQEELFKTLNKLNDISKTMSRIEDQISQIWRATVEEMSIKEKDLIIYKFNEEFKNHESVKMFSNFLRENL